MVHRDLVDHGFASNPGLTVGVALAIGMLAQVAARHLELPGIVLLLLAGALLGPDAADVVQPDTLGHALQTLVGFAVAVILFEGAMNLDISRLRRQERAIRRLVSVGPIVTTIGGTLAAHYVLGWGWRESVLFGTLVIVTGPTVITPLLRRIRVHRPVKTVLEAESVFGDAIGATIAVVALEVAISPSVASFAEGFLHIGGRLLMGGALGLASGLVLAYLLRSRRAVPEGLENVLTLSVVLAIFHLSNAILPESGIAAAIGAGLAMGNVRSRVSRRLMEFKEQLTVMLIGLLFVLLAADVRLSDVQALGAPGLVTVAILMFVVRPLGVWLSTSKTGLSWREKLFVAWIGPRGIVAAAVASFFASQLERSGLPGGEAMRAMVFLVIAVTVGVAGLTGGLTARLLGVERPKDTGWVVLGANHLARAMARALRDFGEDVISIDTNPDHCRLAEEEGLRVIYGNGLEERTLLRTQPEIRAGFVGATPNEETNFLFAQKVHDLSREARVVVGLETAEGVTPEMVHDAASAVLFGREHRGRVWSMRFDRNEVTLERWRYEPMSDGPIPVSHEEDRGMVLPMVVSRAGRAAPFDDEVMFETGDEVLFAFDSGRLARARAQLLDRGWKPIAPPEQEAAAAAG